MNHPPDWRLYLVTDRSLIGSRNLVDVVREAVQGGVTIVQLREKSCSTREFLDLARRLLALLKPLHIPLLINDRVDIALAIGADGAHLGPSDMPYPDARRLLGPNALIGLSVQTPAQVAETQPWDVDYLGVSPIFPTPTKTDTGTPWGLDGLRSLAHHNRHPLVAIGGIHPHNAAAVIHAGAHGIAVVSAICAAPNPRTAATTLRHTIDSALST
jgi:thiamine-phosphate pyrophosphorylase